jgi:spore maturation protein CgeB
MLFVASLHHPEPGPAPPVFQDDADRPLFPPTQAHHFWVKALRRLGHTCAVFWRSRGAGLLQPRRSLRMEDRVTLSAALQYLALRAPAVNPWIRRRNRRLLDAVASFEPDVLILVGDNDIVLPATLEAIRRQHGVRIVYASGTSPVVFSRRIEREAAPLYDLVLANDRNHAVQWRELGAARAQVLPLSAIDPDVHRPATAPTDGDRVVFVGTLVPERLYRQRIEALAALRSFPLDIWSVHAVPGVLAPFFRGPALGQRMLDVVRAAAIAVNPHGDFMQDGGNMRLFEACGLGALQVVDDRPAVREWFVPGTHLVTYDTPERLTTQVAHYLAHPDERRRIAADGCRHVHAHHTFDHRMRALTSLVAALPKP